MKSVNQGLRLFHIYRVLRRYGLDELLLATHLFRPLRLIAWLWPGNWFRRFSASRGERIRCALEDLGPIFIKFGQMLSTRPDLLPPDIATELTRLQDRVPPFPGNQAVEIIERSLQMKLDEAFTTCDENPLASASIAQVHAAELTDGRKVIVKVVRPNIAKTIKRDVSLLYTLAELAERYWPEARRLRPVEVVAEYEKTIFDELDLLREAASASQLRRNFEDSSLLYIPEVYWPFCRRDVMVMERIHGIPISSVDKLRQANIDLVELSERGVEIFFTQVFKHNFFHADMHPGNIFVGEDGQYIAVDFGIVGTLMPEDQRYLAENFLAFFHRDYRRVAELHVDSGWVPEGTRVDEFEAAIRTVCEPIFEKPLKDISFGQILLRLFQTARRFDMEVQPQLVLLQKTLLNIEGLGRELNPDLDLWRTAKPFLENWMQERMSPVAVFAQIKQRFPGWLETFPEMPQLVHDALDSMRQKPANEKQMQQHHQALIREKRAQSSRLYTAVSGGSLLIASALFSLNTKLAAPVFLELPWLSWLMGLGGLIILLAGWPRSDGVRG